MIKKTLFILLLCLGSQVAVLGSDYIGSRQYDGEHKNELSGYIMAGSNVVSGGFGGFEATYRRHLTPRWYVGGDMQMQFWKQLYSFDAKGGYCLPVRFGHIYFDATAMLNRYSRWGFTETLLNLSATWESAYFDIRLGESLIHFRSTTWGVKYGYTEPLTLTVGLGVNIRHRSNPWNIGLYARNYDDFYFENWNINWGIRWYANVNPKIRLFGELNIRPAGSISQLASRYESSMKVGLKYKL